jgi:hypothetical protein
MEIYKIITTQISILNSIVQETVMIVITQIIIINVYINRAGAEKGNKVKVHQIKHTKIPEIILIQGKGMMCLVRTTRKCLIRHILNTKTLTKGEKIGKRMK